MGAKDDICKRNWQKCVVFQDVEGTEFSVFAGGHVTQAVLSGLSEYDEYPVLPVISAQIEDLLAQERSGVDVYLQLDKLLTISLLPPALQRLCLQKIHIETHHLLNADSVDDIGHIIRDIMVQKNNNDVLFKLYHYTMPFIKHNRLNFPPMRYVSKSLLTHLMQIMALTCLGLHRRDCKTPTWHIRRKLFKFFTRLNTHGTLKDIYLFCDHHNYLLRLALMENFVNYTSKHMLQEIDVICRNLKWTKYEHKKVERLVCYITDTFRTGALQNETLDWTFCEHKAQLAIERCNRTCKSQTLVQPACIPNVQRCIDGAVFRQMLATPVFQQNTLLQEMSRGGMLETAIRWNMNTHIRKYALPLQLQHTQFSDMRRLLGAQNQHSMCVRSRLHVCLRCNNEFPGTSNNMRLDHELKAMCVTCQSSAFVFVADTIGHLLRVYRNYYYYCHICRHVHPWTGTGSEFFACRHLRQAQPSRHCTVCFRTMHLTQHHVFDKRLGVIQSLFLCNRHNPTPLQMQYVYDLGSLRLLVKHISS